MTVYRMISAEKARTPVSVCCALLGVSRSGYYDWERRAPSDRALTDAWLIEKIREIWAENRKVYGSPRIHADLRLKYGVRVARKRVERLMREAGISGLQRRKRGRTTIRVPGVRVADDLVERQFCPAAPNVLCGADGTGQWHADRRSRRPKLTKPAEHPKLRRYVPDRLAGAVERPDGVRRWCGSAGVTAGESTGNGRGRRP